MSTGPSRRATSFTMRRTAVGSVTSHSMVSTSAPTRRSASPARSSASASRPQIAIRAPSAAASRANTSPSPREPPVTSTVRPARVGQPSSRSHRLATQAAAAQSASLGILRRPTSALPRPGRLLLVGSPRLGQVELLRRLLVLGFGLEGEAAALVLIHGGELTPQILGHTAHSWYRTPAAT